VPRSKEISKAALPLLTGEYDGVLHRDVLHAAPGEIPAVMNDVIRRVAAPTTTQLRVVRD